jgi:hypothetical protein
VRHNRARSPVPARPLCPLSVPQDHGKGARREGSTAHHLAAVRLLPQTPWTGAIRCINTPPICPPPPPSLPLPCLWYSQAQETGVGSRAPNLQLLPLWTANSRQISPSAPSSPICAQRHNRPDHRTDQNRTRRDERTTMTHERRQRGSPARRPRPERKRRRRRSRAAEIRRIHTRPAPRPRVARVPRSKYTHIPLGCSKCPNQQRIHSRVSTSLTVLIIHHLSPSSSISSSISSSSACFHQGQPPAFRRHVLLVANLSLLSLSLAIISPNGGHP